MQGAGLELDDESLTGLTTAAADLKGPQARCLALGLVMAEELRGIGATGVQLKDPEIGLCDFRSERDGRPVLLCWKLGEPAVAHWHELAAGFAGRQPLEPRGVVDTA
jgi:hypothetical protein